MFPPKVIAKHKIAYNNSMDNEQLAKSFDKQFDRLYVYMEKRFDEIDKRLEHVEDSMATKDSINHLINTMDDFIRRIENNEIEQASRDAQFARLVVWAREVSKKTGVPLPDL